MIIIGSLKIVWDFAQKLPIEDTIKKELQEKPDFLDLLEGQNQLSNENNYKIYYYLTVIQKLALSDDYYWKL